jgi:uncharacterized protein (TIGR03437 family)
MLRKLQLSGCTLAILGCAAAHAASIATTATINAAGSVSATGLALTGTASLTNGIGSGTFTAVLAIATANYSGPYSITLSGGGAINGMLTVPATALSGSGSGSATVTGGSGAYSGAAGSFPSLAVTSTIGASGIALTVTGSGTITTGGTVGPAPPIVTAVLDAASNTAGVAQGGIFIVKGTNLCPTENPTAVYNVPRPTVGSDGVKITFTPAAGGTATDTLLWYEYNPGGASQLAGILPSTVAPGNYNVTVTNGTVSAPFAAQVTQSKFELFTQDSSGSGMASVQNYISASEVDLNSFTTGNGKSTTISPAHPGQYMQAYGTGMGPLVGGDNSASPDYDFSSNGYKVAAIVGGMNIPVLYAGRAGYAGEDQITFALPSNVPTGCTTSFQISVNGVLSVPTYIAIAPNTTAAACVQPGFTTAQLQNLDDGGAYTAGGFSLVQIQETVSSVGSIKSNSASGSFTEYTAYQFSGAASAASATTVTGACTVTESTTTGAVTTVSGSGIGLDAGAVTLNGPSGSSVANLAFTEGAAPYYGYSLMLATTGLPTGSSGTGTIVAGQYTVSGAGGKDVGKFSSSITVGAPLTIAGGLPTSVNRSAGLPLSWTGGNSSDLVEILGSSSTTTGTGANATTTTWGFFCTTTAGTGGFTVSSSVLLQLPAATLSSGNGFLEVASTVTPSTFNAPLTAGGSINGTFVSFLGYGGQVSYQ